MTQSRFDAHAPGQTADVTPQVCVRCVMDTSDPEIQFDAGGVCNHCRGYDLLVAQLPTPERARQELQQIVEVAKAAGRGRPYDCVVGLSGGVDSSYLALQAVQLGLRPLAIHFDNGWNSEHAVHNIESVVRGLDLDLLTYVVDWEEFRDLQKAFFRASVIDIEMLTDHAISAVVLRTARDRKIRHVLRGVNFRTEAILPQAWVHSKLDLRNIRAIHARHGQVPMGSFPTTTTLTMRVMRLMGRIEIVDALNLLPYDKAAAMHTLHRELGWVAYGGKHHESVFTRFYQGYILPRKFGVDKRRAHLSTLICSGQTTRAAALNELGEPIYDPDLATEDRAYVLKKLAMSEQEFAAYIAAPPRPHGAFASEEAYLRLLRAAWFLPRRVRSLTTRFQRT